MTVMIIPTETVLESTPHTNPEKIILKSLNKDDVDSSERTVSTYASSSTFDLDFSTCDFVEEDAVKGPIVTPATRPILKREDSDGSQSKSVRFDSVQIRSHSQTLGDNPSVMYGPPISLDWDYEQLESIKLDDYEADRVFSRRTMRQMAVSYYRRKAILTREYGFSEEELVKAHKDADKVKIKRAITNTLLPMMQVEAALESAGRKAKRIIKRK